MNLARTQSQHQSSMDGSPLNESLMWERRVLREREGGRGKERERLNKYEFNPFVLGLCWDKSSSLWQPRAHGHSRAWLLRSREVGRLGMRGILRGREEGWEDAVGLWEKLSRAQMAKPPASHLWMTDGQSQRTGPRMCSKISMCCKIVHNSAAVRMVWLGRRVWWKCRPVWNDGNVKGSNDWQAESWVHWRGSVMMRWLPKSNNLQEVKHKHVSALRELNQDEYV